MHAKDILSAIVFELTARKPSIRTPEPDLVMAEAEQVLAYSQETRVDGVMAPLYLLFAALATEVIKPGELVLDLGGGAGNHLLLLAQLNPESKFISIDLSPTMLQQAERNHRSAGIKNITLEKMDMTNLSAFADQSVDVVVSSMALHHLADVNSLRLAHLEMNRVVRPGGAFCLLDFERMKSPRTIDVFVERNKSLPEVFVTDYLNSLKAAFSREEFQSAAQGLSHPVTASHMFLVSFLYVLKSAPRKVPSFFERQSMNRFFGQMPESQQADFRALLTFLGLGRLKRMIG